MNNGPENTLYGKDAAVSATAGDAPVDDARLEAALQLALRPAEIPAGFTDRVLARAYAGDNPTTVAPLEPQRAGKLLHWPQSRLWITGAVAAALLIGIFEGGVAVERVREQHRKIVQATQQFQASERITMHALAQAKEQLQRAGVQLSVE